jgi:hypothetical protein
MEPMLLLLLREVYSRKVGFQLYLSVAVIQMTLILTNSLIKLLEAK